MSSVINVLFSVGSVFVAVFFISPTVTDDVALVRMKRERERETKEEMMMMFFDEFIKRYDALDTNYII